MIVGGSSLSSELRCGLTSELDVFSCVLSVSGVRSGADMDGHRVLPARFPRAREVPEPGDASPYAMVELNCQSVLDTWPKTGLLVETIRFGTLPDGTDSSSSSCEVCQKVLVLQI